MSVQSFWPQAKENRKSAYRSALSLFLFLLQLELRTNNYKKDEQNQNQNEIVVKDSSRHEQSLLSIDTMHCIQGGARSVLEIHLF